MKKNNDGSLKLGTLQTEKLYELAIAHNTALQADIKVSQDELAKLDSTADADEYAELEAMIAEDTARIIDIGAVQASQKLVDDAVESHMKVIKSKLDGRLKIRVSPKEPASVENIEVPFLADGYVSYLKRKNPTRSAVTKAQLAEAAKAEYSHRKSSLIAQLHDLEKGSDEEKAILDQLLAL
jgi:hypothetical protein